MFREPLPHIPKIGEIGIPTSAGREVGLRGGAFHAGSRGLPSSIRDLPALPVSSPMLKGAIGGGPSGASGPSGANVVRVVQVPTSGQGG